VPLPEHTVKIAKFQVNRWLTTNQDWLLLLDNVEDLTVVRDFVHKIIDLSSKSMDIYFTKYLQYRAKTRGFDLTILEEILRYSLERYHDIETRRSLMVGKHRNTLVLIPYEKENSVIIPVTVHVTTRQQIKFRLQTGRFTYESTSLF
jgi:hypothetical protein